MSCIHFALTLRPTVLNRRMEESKDVRLRASSDCTFSRNSRFISFLQSLVIRKAKRPRNRAENCHPRGVIGPKGSVLNHKRELQTSWCTGNLEYFRYYSGFLVPSISIVLLHLNV